MDISGIESRINDIQSRMEQLSALVNPAATGQPFSAALSAAALPSGAPAGAVAPDGEAVRPLGPDQLNIARPTSLTDSQLDPIVNSAAQKYGVDPQVVKAVIQTESSGNPAAVSRAGALGLMQLMPSNVQASDVSDPFDPVQNVNAGVAQLSGYLKQYDGNLDKALAAYNAGPGAVEQFHGIPPYAETQDYIKKIHSLLDR